MFNADLDQTKMEQTFIFSTMTDFTDRVVQEYNKATDCANQAGDLIGVLDQLVSEDEPLADQRQILWAILNTSFRANQSFHRLNLWSATATHALGYRSDMQLTPHFL